MNLKLKSLLLLMAVAFIIPTGCKKDIGDGNFDGKHGAPAELFDAKVPLAWFKLGITLARTTPGNTGPVASRTFGFMGLALYESVVPGMPDNRSIQSQLNGLPALPKADKLKKYYYPVSANAALASMVRHMFGNASAAQNFTIDSLENALNDEFRSALTGLPVQQFSSHDFDRSVSFGQEISNAIYNWSTTDGRQSIFTC
jgi:hypothetical protein